MQSSRVSASPLRGKARTEYERLGINHLLEGSFERDIFRRFTHCHQIVAYPPLSTLQEANQNEVLKGLLPRKREVTAYLHIPFCTGRCSYCMYVTYANPQENFMRDYLAMLRKEVENFRRAVGEAVWDSISFISVYIGGGTPTFLKLEQLASVVSWARSAFRLPMHAEFTMEASPETVRGNEGCEKLEAARKAGINRLSLGIQTFDDAILKRMGRRHTGKKALEAYENARRAGFENINIDLIPGLPDATLQKWERDIVTAGELKPASLTAYPLGIKEDTAIFALYQKEPHRFPAGSELALMQLMAREHFTSLGYAENPILWYALDPHFEYRQQVFKWGKCGEMLGFGVSSYSYFNRAQWFNHHGYDEWGKAVEEGKLPLWKGKRLGKHEEMRRHVIFGLKVAGGVDKAKFRKMFGVAVDDLFGETIRNLAAHGLIENMESSLRASEKGKLFIDEVVEGFFSARAKADMPL